MYKQVTPQQEMAVYAARIVETLLRDIAYAIPQALEQPTADRVHDLRVTCLRLRHALRVFARLFGEKRARKIRRRLGEIQDLLAAVRTCDIGLKTLEEETIAAAVTPRQRRKMISEINLERRRCLRPLQVRLRKIQRSDSLQRWRTRLMPAA